ncbi:L-seryl-tRNA(Sec) selenium transferase [Actinobacteria bacterium YIM 96077]|uniref:L-seryl-tRNA(Sec) selenium transferase n=1 Tax=Phytoactinopolyspora halophila TaxID=1981511 RepID=A0A329QVL5_9ACTN|nr:L-seryl-tRNA(Sec) selenium transferase [Phytoactinopolyspora halophila]AYY14216.1 L-seryl-tRNA(Sec) selenium transferase [Actinobacteria bacterium YIM 96077]RAW14758.1 L-seryl-tRNA(Sec) selenium transferase [Phytoactinopolyspora halophila]
MLSEHDAESRRRIPGTDTLLAEPRFTAATSALGRDLVKAAITQAQDRARRGEITPEDVGDTAAGSLPPRASTLRPVINATGVVLHTNLGRAPLSPAAVAAVHAAAGHTDVEYDTDTGRRDLRGRGVVDALGAAVPSAEAAHVVNNGAAALVLAATALAPGQEVVVSRGELVEIGDGFRLPELLESTGAVLREVGTTNRTRLDDYRAVLGPDTGFVLKVHPSNFVIQGFTSSVSIRDLAQLGATVVADLGSGLLSPDPLLPDEPDASSALADGAALVTGSGDKLLGGPQAGLLLGRAEIIEQLRRHPLARALRVDKLTLAALEATLRGPETPTWAALRHDAAELHARAEELRDGLRQDGVTSETVETASVVGGGGGPGLELTSWAVAVDPGLAAPLRQHEPAVVGRLERDRLLLDLRCVPSDQDSTLRSAVVSAWHRQARSE